MLGFVDKQYFKLCIPGPYKESDLDIAAKCPICGDSKHKRSSKRLHLFYKDKSTRIKCFNGGCQLESPHSVKKFLKIYYPQFLEPYLRETLNFSIRKIAKTKTEKTESFTNSKFSESIQIQHTQHTPQAPKVSVTENYGNGRINSKVEKIINCLEVLNTQGIAFLESRCLRYNQLKEVFGEFYSGTNSFNHEGKYYNLKNTLFIPIFSKCPANLKDMVCFYARDIAQKRFVNGNIIDSNIFIPWNLNAINNDKEVYIFEAILDALSFYELYNETNIIALCTNNINQKILDYIKNPIFCLDNDVVGTQTMLKYTDTQKAKFLIYPDGLQYKDFNDILRNNAKFDLNFESAFKSKILLRKKL